LGRDLFDDDRGEFFGREAAFARAEVFHDEFGHGHGEIVACTCEVDRAVLETEALDLDFNLLGWFGLGLRLGLRLRRGRSGFFTRGGFLNVV